VETREASQSAIPRLINSGPDEHPDVLAASGSLPLQPAVLLVG
jgi:hypothetical protein